jgi:hypothetical protein
VIVLIKLFILTSESENFLLFLFNVTDQVTVGLVSFVQQRAGHLQLIVSLLKLIFSPSQKLQGLLMLLLLGLKPLSKAKGLLNAPLIGARNGVEGTSKDRVVVGIYLC